MDLFTEIKGKCKFCACLFSCKETDIGVPFMRITFQNINADKEANPVAGNRANHSGKTPAEAAGRASSVSKSAAYDTSDIGRGGVLFPKNDTGKGKTMTTVQQEAACANADVLQDYMTLMSNTMSDEDYAQLEREGFHFASMDPAEAVTIVDKIKAEVARSGKTVAGYNDDLDPEALAEVLGSEALARAIVESFRQADLPLTEENKEAVAGAWEMASALKAPSEGEYRYLVDNHLGSEIRNFYLAKNSGAGDGGAVGARYYEEAVNGYYTASATADEQTHSENYRDQMDRILAQEGIEPDEENRALADWLAEKELPVTGENIHLLEELRSVEFPVSEDAFARAVANALAEGKPAVNAKLAVTPDIYEQAQYLARRYDQAGDVAARRQLEEVRLRMTAEVNVKLIRSGFSIDTAPMEEFLEALRLAEREVAQKYFPGEEDAVSKYELFHETNRIVGEIPGLPAQTIGFRGILPRDLTLREFHALGTEAAGKADFAEAARTYETVGTAPRADLGDSIRKAFANVDELLGELDLPATEENRKSVRILGYNSMEITPENVQRITQACRTVEEVVNHLKPAATLKMIRDGINPLEKSFAELEQYFDELPESYREVSESYSRFLYGLERRHEISEQERESFIGVYRLLAQIEKTDGAAIGALVNTQAQLQFSNLLSAIRSGRFKGIDVKVSDELGSVVERVRSGETIDAQIQKAFVRSAEKVLTEVSHTEEALFRDEELSNLRQVSDTAPEAVALLKDSGQTLSAENLLAAEALLQDGGQVFKTLAARERRFSAAKEASAAGADRRSGMDKVTQLSDHLESRAELEANYEDAYETLLTELEAETFLAEGSLDVRELQFLHKQMSIARALPNDEDYIFPMYIGEELTRVHLTFRRGSGEGSIRIRAQLSENSSVEADMRVRDHRVEGLLIGKTSREVMKLREAADIFSSLVETEFAGAFKVDGLTAVEAGTYTGSHSAGSREEQSGDSGTEAELYRIAGAFLQALRQ